MIKAVIFDFDDTMCMTGESNHKMTSEALQKLGYEPMTLDEHMKTVGDPLKVTLAKYYPGLDIETLGVELNAIRAERFAKGLVEQIPQANLDALDELAKQGKTLMILSSRREDGFKGMMDSSHHLGSRIAHFYHLGNNPHHKPDPKVFAVIEKEHGLYPRECVYVGDALNDAAAATGAGLHFIANLENGMLTKEDFKDFPVEVFIDKLPEVVGAVKKIENS